MSSLLASLQSAGSALREFERAAAVNQNNVINASTPGYAAQVLRFEAVAVAPELGLYGGVKAGPVESARDEYAEASVRRQTSQYGLASQQSESLSALEGAFDITGQSGVPAALNTLFNAFGTWANSPNDPGARQEVMTAAGDAALSFRQTAAQLSTQSAGMVKQAQSVVDRINTLAAHLAGLNKSLRTEGRSDNAVETQVYSDFEELSSLTDFTLVKASDNTFTVLVGGQVPLVVGDRAYNLTASPRAVATAGSPPALQITDSSGQDVTALIHGGKLAGLISTVNTTIGGLLGDDSGPGTLNQLAAAVATRINQILSSGIADDTTAPPVPGTNLFAVTPGGAAAATLDLVAGVTPAQLAAIQPGPPKVANGIAKQLAGLPASSAPADQIAGVNYTEFYGSMAASLGRSVESAKTDESRYAQLAAQARSLRSDLSGVSLDEEATKLVEFQRAYQAAARTVSVVNDMMDTLINLIPQ